MAEISVIVPVYKVEKYINRCIDSILTQTFRDFELILVDDGSPDKCGKICEKYAQKMKELLCCTVKTEACQLHEIQASSGHF